MNKLQRWIGLLSLLAGAAACSLTQNTDVTYVIVTSTPDPGQALQSPTPPTSPPPPTSTPEPTVEPGIALRIADRYLLNGYYENAVQTYRVILGQGESAPQDIRAAAAYNMGQAALREGLFADAVNALTALIDQFPQDARVAQAHFLRGDAYMGLSRWAEAIADFQTYLTLRPGLIESYARERIGDAQLALGQTQEALTSYQQATQANRSLVPQLVLREKAARVLISAGQVADAIAQYDAILSVAQNAPYRASIEFAAAQALIDSGDTENGLSRMQRVFNTYAETNWAYRAMQALRAHNVPLDDFAQGKVSYRFGDYEDAIAAFNRYTSSTPLEAIPAELSLLLGRAYREVGNSAAANTAFQTIVEQYPQDPLFGEALLEQGRTKFLANDISGAVTQYLRIADNYGYLPQAAEALWRAGYLYGTNNEPGLSRLIFERLANEYPNTEQARSGLFIAASAAVNAGDTAGAERLFGILATTATGDDQAAAYLWVGRLALQRGDVESANTAFRLAQQAAPDSYFAARAGDIVSRRDPFESPASLQFEFDDVTQLNEAENWLRQTFNIAQEGYLWPLSPALEADPRMMRGRELWAVGAYLEAEEEFYDVIDEKREARDALSSYQLAIFLRGISAYQPSIVAAADVIRAAGVPTLSAPPYIARMRYPAYYRDVVLDVAQRRGFDPLLMFALIRHESLFDTNATAAAGEKGLTQVIPSTAEYIAEQLNWPDYQHSDLFRPYAGIEFGAYYLDEQLRRFDYNVPVALSGYNAGPGRAANWLTLSGGDPDLFMATITIDSTRLYVQLIYSHYNIYRALYGSGG